MIICLGTTPALQRTMSFARLTLDAVNRTSNVREFASGKSTNVARVLHALGNEVLSTGFLGGKTGETFRGDLDASGIAHDFVEVNPSTRMCITVIDEKESTATELIEESKAPADADYEALLQKLSDHLKSAKLLVLSGTLPPGAKSDFYARCVQLAGANVRVVADAVGEPLVRALEYRPFVIKPNQNEIARTLGIEIKSESELRDAMCQLVARGAQWVIATHGKADTLITNGQSFWIVAVPSVKAISPIGSGDSFAAGLAAALIRGEEVPQAVILATACGAANAMTPDAGHVRPEDISMLEKQITFRM